MASTTKKKAQKPSKVVKPKANPRRSTVSTRHHRFQSFSERVVRLKIAPVRRRRNPVDREELSDDTSTYFGRSLEEWKDLNLSATFTAFARQATPLCDSLPMVLHNEEKIMDLFVAYIEKEDGLALEPLLGLLSHFAHDLDTRFEKHFQRAVAMLTKVAASHDDPAVIEWSFTSLAWLFKYLSRVLVPDLRPLYDLMAPYLGKTSRKPFIIRFTAESLAFLVRKAAATYERHCKPLDLVVSYILKDCLKEQETGPSNLRLQGVMTLLTETIKGVQGGIHSGGLAVLQSILKQLDTHSNEDCEAILEILTGTLTSLIHYTNAETFQPVLGTVLDSIDASNFEPRPNLVGAQSSIVFTLATVRKGTRIADWTRIFATLKTLVHLGQNSLGSQLKARQSVLSATAAAFQFAPIDAVLPALPLLESLRHGTWTPHFLQFCDLFARFGRERFQSFLLPHFKRFVLEQWGDNVDATLFSMPKLLPNGQQLDCPKTLGHTMLSRISYSTCVVDEQFDLQRLSFANLAMSALPYFKLDATLGEQVQAELITHVTHALETKDTSTDTFYNFALGTCFAGLLDNAQDSVPLRKLWPMLCTESSRFLRLPIFWANMLRYIEICPPSSEDLKAVYMTHLEESLLESLSSSSHHIRQSALEFMQSVYRLRDLQIPDVLSVAISIESTPISLENSRSISMNVRRLGSSTTESDVDDLMRRAIPSYCFGLLHLQLAQTWEDAIDVLAKLSKHPVGEEVITALIQRWLEGRSREDDKLEGESQHCVLDIESGGFQVASDFECSNFVKINAISQQALDTPNGGYPSSLEQLRIDTASTPFNSPNDRGQALRVLNKIPNLAEKKSRMLVPVLLPWASSDNVEAGDGGFEHGWSRKDQKAMLAVFAQFTNPKVLFKSGEVYLALLNLCSNGDVEIQRSAFKAVLAWKEPAINSYQEHVSNLLDESRFREEMSVFLENEEGDDAAIQPEHRHKLMPVLLRLLYGRAVAGGKNGQSSRRKAIFLALSRYDESVLELFINIVLGSIGQIYLVQRGTLDVEALTKLEMPPRQQLGMLNMINDMLETLGSDLARFAERLLNAVVLCTVAATRNINSAVDNELQHGSLLRSVRQVGTQCLAKIFSTMTDSSFSAHSRVVLDELLAPRLDRFATENCQSVSALLHLLSAWSASSDSASYLLNHLTDLPNRIADLLCEPSAKDEVRLFVIDDILDNLVQSDAQSGLRQEQVTNLVQSIGKLLHQQPSKDVLNACVAMLMKLAGNIKDVKEVQSVIDVCTQLLIKPSKIVSPITKTNILKTLSSLIDVSGYSASPLPYDALCGLFSRLHDQEARELLSVVFRKLCKGDNRLLDSAEICEDLNALSTKLDEPDHERREQGFSKIYRSSDHLSFQQWQPILHNCLFYVRDVDDLVNRASSSRALQLFVNAASTTEEEMKPLILSAIIPGVEHGMKVPSELVRAEYLQLLGHLVEKMPGLPSVKDMKGLTIGGDDEASVFSNILHIQQHRRLRALRRLSEEAKDLKSNNVTRIFLPLLEHFVFDQVEGDAGRTLADQVILTIGALAQALSWPAFRATFKRYIGYLSSKEDHEKVIMRLLGALVDSLVSTKEESEDNVVNKNREGRYSTITGEFLPPLLDYIHLKDESTVDRRMPVAITIVKLLLHLPESQMSSKLAPVLTDICHVLRSRSQEARDQTRKTLAAVLSLIGPAYLGFILKELRGALQRGSQLHVLSYTVHSLLISVIENCQPGDLDHCLPKLASIIMDDIFGPTGQEKDAEEYKSSMKEVKSSKSFDTMELLARVTPIPRLGLLMQPLRALLSEKLDSTMLRKIDELLTRLRKGIDQNHAADSREMLMFCHEVIRQVHNDKPSATSAKASVHKGNRYLIQMEKSNKLQHGGYTTLQTFKLASFAFNLLRKVLRRHPDLLTPSNLTAFLPLAGDALVQGQEEVQTSAVKLLSVVMKLPLTELENSAPVYVNEAVRLIKSSPSMTTDSARAALDLITSVLREKRSVNIKDRDVGQVLKALQHDIDEPDRQGIIYKFLRAVLGRKVVITEVYELMDDVAKVTITNPDRNVRESARSAYVQFILEYPQGKDRWNKQAAFFVQNLKYEHSTGRQSVMELLHKTLPKLQDTVLEQLAFTLFVALVPVLSSDPVESCRQMAGILITKVFERTGDEQLDIFLSLMTKWLQAKDNSTLEIAALKCWTVALRARAIDRVYSEGLRDNIDALLGAHNFAELDNETQVIRNALQTFDAMVNTVPGIAFARQSAGIWDALQTWIAVGQTDVQESALKLVEVYFSHLASSASKAGFDLSAIPLRGSYGLEMGVDHMRQVSRANLRALQAEPGTSNDAVATQTARNLVFLGRCFAANNLEWTDNKADSAEEDDEENGKPQQHNLSAIQHLFNRLSYVIRQEHLSTTSRIAALQCQIALTAHVAEIPNLVSVIRPLYLLTDPAVPQPSDETHKNLMEKARELLEVIQQKVGTELYLSALASARAKSKLVREERRRKRKIEAVSAPEKWAKEKRKKYEAKQNRSKAGSMAVIGRRRGW